MLRGKGKHNYGFQPSLFRDSILAGFLALVMGSAEFLVPFLIWPITAIMAVAFQMEWPSSIYVLGFLVVVPVVIGSLLWVLSPKNDKSLAIHAAVASSLISALLFVIDLSGWSKFAIFAMVAIVPLLCLTLSIRVVMGKQNKSGFDHIFAKAGADGGNMRLFHINDEVDEDEDELS